MNTAIFTVWLLLYMNPTTGGISMHGQFWTDAACQQELRHRSIKNDNPPRLYVCHRLVVPEPKP